jgi:hypothetical protein
MAAVQVPTAVAEDKSKIDWWQLVMFLIALLCFTGAAILWTHSG